MRQRVCGAHAQGTRHRASIALLKRQCSAALALARQQPREHALCPPVLTTGKVQAMFVHLLLSATAVTTEVACVKPL